jgi:hypothetical protein
MRDGAIEMKRERWAARANDRQENGPRAAKLAGIAAIFWECAK